MDESCEEEDDEVPAVGAVLEVSDTSKAGEDDYDEDDYDDTMVPGRQRLRIVVLLGSILVFSFFWHWLSIQHSLVVLLENCAGRFDTATTAATQATTKAPTPGKSELQTRIDAIFDKIQSFIPKVNFTDFSRTTSATNSKVFIVKPKEQYCIGEDFVVQVDAYDYLGSKKTFGGDFLRPRFFSPELGAAVSGKVEDFNNGSYHIHFPLNWLGIARVSILFWHPSEGIASLWRSRHSSQGVIGFQGRYVFLDQQGFSPCGFQLNLAGEICEYKDELYEEVFYCQKPHGLPCDCLREMRAVDLHSSYLSPEEKTMFQGSQIGVEIAQNLQPITVAKCSEMVSTPKPKCQTGMSSSFPSGYFFNNIWIPNYCNMTVYNTGEDFTKCLQGKSLYLIGDSTLRQYIMHFTEGIKIVNYFRYHGTSWQFWEKTLEAVNMEKDIYVNYKRHGFPLESFEFYYFMEDMYTSRQIDLRGGGKDTIFVITMGQHFRQFPLKLYIKRALNIRTAIQRLLLRSPETKVIIKTENTRETLASPERTGDFHGYCQYLVLREVFQGINVGFVDAWDMTVASATASVHPPGHTFASIMSLTFSFACP
ncbi:NXPE family member 4-like [Hyperolius riggenbachi]|uniref:NXPE family member 4-like n=1 Tax=Hyperolius riggenbachi TaxID=752182 RepID=UPI0035A2BB25